MGVGGSRELRDTNFGGKLCADIQLSLLSLDFCDLVIFRLRNHGSTHNAYFKDWSIVPNTLPGKIELLEEKCGPDGVRLRSYRAHKVVVSAAFPKLDELLQKNHSLCTNLPDEVIINLGAYAYYGELILDDHLLGVLGVMLELMPTHDVRTRITDEVRDHVQLLLKNWGAVKTMSTAEMAAVVFVAKLHDLEVIELLFDWKVGRATLGDDLEGIYMEFMTYLLKSGKGDPLSPYGVLDGKQNIDP